MKSSSEILAHNVRMARKTRGWSQATLANKTGLQRTYIGHIEQGRRNPTLKIVDQIAQVFETDAYELLVENNLKLMFLP